MKKAVISLSGGMDSTSLFIHLLANEYFVKAYNFDYGSRQNSLEIKRIQENIFYLQRHGFNVQLQHINLKEIFNESNSALFIKNEMEIPEEHYTSASQKVTVVENRNAIFSNIIFSKALSWANKTGEDVVISLGIHSGDHAIYKDCTPEFREAMEKAMKLGNDNSERVNYYVPYINKTKEDILIELKENCWHLKLDFYEILKNTLTCYNPNELGESCGKCGSCIERLEAFERINEKDPLTYIK
jgi:7-cyano-7-deazaguanine synthase